MTNQSQQSIDEQAAKSFAYSYSVESSYNSRTDDIEDGFLAGIQHERSRLAVSKTDEEAWREWEGRHNEPSVLLDAHGAFMFACAYKSAQQAAKDAEGESRAAYNREWMQEAEVEIERLKADNTAKDARINQIIQGLKGYAGIGCECHTFDVMKCPYCFAEDTIKALADRAELSKQKGGDV